jgi:hypothetical protein
MISNFHMANGAHGTTRPKACPSNQVGFFRRQRVTFYNRAYENKAIKTRGWRLFADAALNGWQSTPPTSSLSRSPRCEGLALILRQARFPGE